jgi:hypothetical protein
MNPTRTARAALRDPRRATTRLGCLLALAGPSAVLSAGQAPPPFESDEPPTDAPILEAGEPWSLQIDDVSLTAVLRTDPIETGAPILIEFLLPGSEEEGGLAALELPAPGTEFGSFEVIETPRLARLQTDLETGGGSSPPRLSLRTFEPGPQVLPSIPIGLGDARIRTPARTLLVGSVAGLDTDVEAHQDITAAVEVPSPFPTWVWWTIAAGAAGFLAMLALLWWWRRRPRPVPPPEPADAWALAKLERLASDDLLRNARVDPFFTRLSDIAREYVERRFGIAAPDRTTPEFIEAARTAPEMEPAHRDRMIRLGDILRTADLVKFAGDRPSRNVCEDALVQVRDLVIEIGPKPAPPSETTGIDDGPVAIDIGDRDRRRSLDRAVDGLERMEARE